MDYQVNWPLSWIERILEFHQSARSWRDTAAINSALTVIEDALRRRPLHSGESRDGRRRVIYEPPIQVQYDVFQDERSVLVVGIHYFPGKP